MFKLLELAGALMPFLGMKAEGAKAATEPTEKAAIEMLNFIFIRFLLNITRYNSDSAVGKFMDTTATTTTQPSTAEN
jgi:hypothetical protein